MGIGGRIYRILYIVRRSTIYWINTFDSLINGARVKKGKTILSVAGYNNTYQQFI